MGGVHLGVNCEDAYFIRPDTEEEKNLLKELVEKIRKTMELPQEEERELS